MVKELGVPLGFAAVLVAALLASRAARADVTAPAPAWPDSFVSRVEALALLESLDADLLSHDSATLTLERWCEAHRLASPPRVVAERVPLEKAPSPEQRRELDIGPTEPVRYRRVRLVCGSAVLSEADNWYVPSRLTPEMNARLTTTDTPFGKVVLGLHFQRRTLSSTLLWRPLPEGWEMAQGAGASGHQPAGEAAPRGGEAGPLADGPATPGSGAAPLVIPHAVLENKAILVLPDGTPISEVVETYTSAALGFPPPGAAPRP